ncbi:hypothetical protein K3495_g12989 [Podosphaera aphanis]|nr:hypothetical protein K3495_g12989 [Podosphaera aphanis]
MALKFNTIARQYDYSTCQDDDAKVKSSSVLPTDSTFVNFLSQASRDIWLHDDGASVYITNNIDAFYRYRSLKNHSPVMTGGGSVYPTGIGYIKLRLLRTDNSVHETIIENVLYIPGFPIIIYSGWLHDLKDGWDKHRVLYNHDGFEFCQLLRGPNCLHLRLAYLAYTLN